MDELFDSCVYTVLPYDCKKQVEDLLNWVPKHICTTLDIDENTLKSQITINPDIVFSQVEHSYNEFLDQFIYAPKDDVLFGEEGGEYLKTLVYFPWAMCAKSFTPLSPDYEHLLWNYKYYTKMCTFLIGQEFRQIEQHPIYSTVIRKTMDNISTNDQQILKQVDKHLDEFHYLQNLVTEKEWKTILHPRMPDTEQRHRFSRFKKETETIWDRVTDTHAKTKVLSLSPIITPVYTVDKDLLDVYSDACSRLENLIKWINSLS